MSESRIESRGEGNSEKDFQAFCGPYAIDVPSGSAKSPEQVEQERQERRDGIKRLAILALNMPEKSSWADLAKIKLEGKEGYGAYIQKVQQLLPNRFKLDTHEAYITGEAEKAGDAFISVSGLTIYRGKGGQGGARGPKVDEVLLSTTDPKKKPWELQPYGGKRNPGEKAVAALLREFGEEAGWPAAIDLMHALKEGKVFYTGFYIQTRNFPAHKGLFIQSFAMDGENFDTSKIKKGPSSDSAGPVWANRKQLDALLDGRAVNLTEQAELQMQAFGFDRPDDAKFTHRDPKYIGDPYAYKRLLEAEAEGRREAEQPLDNKQSIKVNEALHELLDACVPGVARKLLTDGRVAARNYLFERLEQLKFPKEEQRLVYDALDWLGDGVKHERPEMSRREAHELVNEFRAMLLSVARLKDESGQKRFDFRVPPARFPKEARLADRIRGVRNLERDDWRATVDAAIARLGPEKQKEQKLSAAELYDQRAIQGMSFEASEQNIPANVRRRRAETNAAIEGRIPPAERKREREFKAAAEELQKRMAALDPRIMKGIKGINPDKLPQFAATMSALLGLEGKEKTRFENALTTLDKMTNWELNEADIRTPEGFATLKKELAWDDAIREVESVTSSLKDSTRVLTDGKYWLRAGNERIVCNIKGGDFSFFVPEYMVRALDNQQPGIGTKLAEGVRGHSGTYVYLADAVEWMNRGFLKPEYRLAIPRGQ